jgi:hypothetical protein
MRRPANLANTDAGSARHPDLAAIRALIYSRNGDHLSVDHWNRRQRGDEVAFTSITFFASMDDVHAFAGTNPDNAVV